ncbi:hypothetical protein U6B65_01420 [Oscillospiraceae bacterium MB08-C2-2]|nr:hypothetical protein U6B65_01420 [Oscillospiraceae bacterium MB08-C2-2]
MAIFTLTNKQGCYFTSVQAANYKTARKTFRDKFGGGGWVITEYDSMGNVLSVRNATL